MTSSLGNISQFWDDAVVPGLIEYIRVPAKSPHFDPDWRKRGHIEETVVLAADWCRRHPVPGMQLEIVRLPERTPVLLLEVPASAVASETVPETVPDTVLVYGHLDKQPEMTGWREGFGPWTPVLEGEKLYGRGGADDGYSIFCAIAALRELAERKQPHARVVALIECCEESGSYDLPAYLDALADRIGTPSLVVGLDSGCGNYEQLWGTSSLRGLVNGLLSVAVLTEGVHSGDASGVVASSFRIARSLLDRIDDGHSGMVQHAEFHVAVPHERLEQARAVGEVLGETLWRRFPFVPGMKPMDEDLAQLILNRTWRPMLEVIGAAGLPAPETAGNVLRPRTDLLLSLRLPPTLEGPAAAAKLKEILEFDPPYGAKVSFSPQQAASGWHAPASEPWLSQAIDAASRAHFGRPALWLGEGGTIPFMAMLGARFPAAQFFITGVLGPHSNAHGPNEFLHLGYAKKLTACVADLLAAHAARSAG